MRAAVVCECWLEQSANLAKYAIEHEVSNRLRFRPSRGTEAVVTSLVAPDALQSLSALKLGHHVPVDTRRTLWPHLARGDRALTASIWGGAQAIPERTTMRAARVSSTAGPLVAFWCGRRGRRQKQGCVVISSAQQPSQHREIEDSVVVNEREPLEASTVAPIRGEDSER